MTSGTLAMELLEAERRAQPLPLPQRAPNLPEAYDLQDEGLRLRRTDGCTQVGYKVGLTSRDSQVQRGIDHPVAGYLLDTRMTDLDCINLDTLIAPRVEIELALIMARPLGGDPEPQDVLHATAQLALALEVVDSRWRQPPAAAGLLVADNVSGSGALLGRHFAPHSTGLDEVRVQAEIDGQPLTPHAENGATTSAHAIGSSVAWLARHLTTRGKSLQRGEIVLSGAIVPPVPVHAGQTLTADFLGIGALHVSFT